MKSHQKTVLLAILLSFSSCDNPEDKSTSAYLGQATAKASLAKIHYEYLSCYALDKAAKKKCNDKLANKYIQKCHAQDNEYIVAFSFESEKQGFKRFLNDRKLPCEAIKQGPEFANNKQAYIV